MKPEATNLLPNLLQFARLLRHSGVEVTPAQVQTLLDALEQVGLENRWRVRDAARTILIGHREQQALFDRAFDLFFTTDAFKSHTSVDLGRILRRVSHTEQKVMAAPPGVEENKAPDVETPLIELRQTWSDREILRHKDFAELTDEEHTQMRRLLKEQHLVLDPRRTRRSRLARSGRLLDVRRTLRQGLRHGGEMIELTWRKRREKPRPLVVLCDISGSMDPYSRLFLQFIYSLKTATERLEAFVFGTRLTRITRQLKPRDIDEALRQATAKVVDWGGGTRIGESLRAFNQDWGRRVLGRGAVVMVISDGWDRGEIAVLDRQVERLAKSCDRLIWLNPLIGSPGYEPLTRGIRVVLRHADDFLPVHNLQSLEDLVAHLAKLRQRG